MISQNTYNSSPYCKQWAATPEDALQRTNEEIARLTINLDTLQCVRDQEDLMNLYSDLKSALEDREFLIG